MAEVVKTIAKRNSNTTGNDLFETPIPIGTDGNYVQMKSKLDLEEQLKLGGNKVIAIRVKTVTIDNADYYYYQIIEWYANKSITIDNENNLPQQADEQYITHTVQTNMYSDGTYKTYNITVNGTDILVENELVNDGQNQIIVIQNQNLNNYDFFSITNIFNSYMDYNDLDNHNSNDYEHKLLHQKYIVIEK